MKKILLNILLPVLLAGTAAAQSWQSVGTFSGTLFPSAEAFTTWNDSMYVIGSFTKMGGDSTINTLARWDGANWSSVGNFNFSGFGVYAIASYNNELYVAGEFSSVNGMPASRIARWNGSRWDSVGPGLNYLPNPSPAAICVYKNELYAGVSTGLAKWDGTAWSFIPNVGGSIRAMIVFNNELYIGSGSSTGEFVSSPHIIKYDGTGFSPVGAGFDTNPGTQILAFAIHNNELYAGGDLLTSGTDTVNNVARWDGTKWNALGQGLNSTVNGLASDGSKLYLTGNFWKVNGPNTSCNRAVSWDGTTFTVMNANGSGKGAHIYKNRLYSGGSQVNRWSVTLTGTNEPRDASAFNVYPNPGNGIYTLSMNAFGETDIQVLNALGDVMYRNTDLAPNSEIDLTQMPAGMYFIQMRSSTGTVTKKIIKN